MKTLVIFYSYTGNTRRFAQGLAKKESADITEVKEVSRPGRVKAYLVGCIAALRGKSWRIQPPGVDLAAYDRLILLSPVWAGNPPPAVNALLEQLPVGKSVFVKMVSASGKSECRDRLELIAKSKGCTIESFEDIKA